MGRIGLLGEAPLPLHVSMHFGWKLMPVPRVHSFIQPNSLLLDLCPKCCHSGSLLPALVNICWGKSWALLLLSEPLLPQPAALHLLCVLVPMKQKSAGHGGSPILHPLLPGAASLKCACDLSRPSKGECGCSTQLGKVLLARSFQDTHPVPVVCQPCARGWGYGPEEAESCCLPGAQGLGGEGGESGQIQGGGLEEGSGNWNGQQEGVGGLAPPSHPQPRPSPPGAPRPLWGCPCSSEGPLLPSRRRMKEGPFSKHRLMDSKLSEISSTPTSKTTFI